MLILSRRPHESIIIDGRIRVMVLDVCSANSSSPKVKLAIDAPDKMTIDREEIHEDKRRRGTSQQGSDYGR